MDKVSVYYLDPLYFRCVLLLFYKKEYKSTLCYEIIKKWLHLGPLNDCIKRHILNFTQQ